jgi:Dolichyl-phosphate-mannose-protein mannosyltransferase
MKPTFARAATSLWLILLVGFGARLAFAWDQERKIPDAALASAPFEQETGSIARAIATGRGFSNPFLRETGPTAWLTPVYPLVVAGTFKIFGISTIPSFFFLVLLNCIFSTAVCVPIFCAGRRVAGVAVASAAAWLWALFPNAIMIPFEWIWDTSLSAFLGAALLWATLELGESQRMRDWCSYGLLWGLTLMTNPALGSLLPPLLGWAGYRAWKKTRLPLTKPALALGVAILCCMPWTIRNYVVFHRFVPLRSNFPLELYIGNNENYEGPRPRFPPPITKERETLRYIHMGETPFMDEEMRKAMKFILSHPRKEGILFYDRFVAFWGGAPNPVQTFLSTDSVLIRALILCATLSGIGALLGIVSLFWRRDLYAFPLAAFPVFFPFLYYVTHTSLRYRHPIDPIVLLLAVIGVHSLWQSWVRLRLSKDDLKASLRARHSPTVSPV